MLRKSTCAEVVRGNVRSRVRKLKHARGSNIWLLGRGQLVREFFNAGLIGRGIPLFVPRAGDTRLKFKSVKTFKSGLVKLAFARF